MNLIFTHVWHYSFPYMRIWLIHIYANMTFMNMCANRKRSFICVLICDMTHLHVCDKTHCVPITNLKSRDWRLQQCAAVCCSALHWVAVCGRVLQCVAVCCSVWPCVAVCTNYGSQDWRLQPCKWRIQNNPNPVVYIHVHVHTYVCTCIYVTDTIYVIAYCTYTCTGEGFKTIQTLLCTYIYMYVYMRRNMHICTYMLHSGVES